MSDFSGRLIFRLSAERPRFYRFDRGRRRCGQGELSWRVYAPPHMTADAVQACAVSILGPLATFERTQPKGAFSFQSEAPSTGNSISSINRSPRRCRCAYLPRARPREGLITVGERRAIVAGLPPPHMTADAVQACAVSILGPLATFERTQPKGAFSFQSEAPSPGNSISSINRSPRRCRCAYLPRARPREGLITVACVTRFGYSCARWRLPDALKTEARHRSIDEILASRASP